MRSFTRLRNVCVVICVAVVLFTVPAFAVVRLDNTPPANPPYMGGYWVSGTDATLGEVVIYVSDNEGWTLNRYGELFRFSNSSASGLVVDSNGTLYTFTASAFSLPRFRNANTSYQYTDMSFNPVGGNIIIDNEFDTPYDLETMCLVFLCFSVCLILVVKLIKRG